MPTGRFEQGDNYRPGEGYRDYRRDSNSTLSKKESGDFYQGSLGSATPDRRSSSVDSTKSSEKRRVVSGRETRTNSIDSTVQSLDENCHADAQDSSMAGPYGKRVRENSLSSEISSSSMMPEESLDTQRSNEIELRDEKRRKVYLSPQDDRGSSEPRDPPKDGDIEPLHEEEREPSRHLSPEQKPKVPMLIEQQDTSGSREPIRAYPNQAYVNKYSKKPDNYKQTSIKPDTNLTIHPISKTHLNSEERLDSLSVKRNEEELSDQLEEGEIGVSELSDSTDNTLEDEKWPRRETFASSSTRMNLSREETLELKQKPKIKSPSVAKSNLLDEAKRSVKSENNNARSPTVAEASVHKDFRPHGVSVIDEQKEITNDQTSTLSTPKILDEPIESPEPGEIDPVCNELQSDKSLFTPTLSDNEIKQTNIISTRSEASHCQISNAEVVTTLEVKSDTNGAKPFNNDIQIDIEATESARNILNETHKKSTANLPEYPSKVSSDTNRISDPPPVPVIQVMSSVQGETGEILDDNSDDEKVASFELDKSSSEANVTVSPESYDVSTHMDKLKYPKCVKVKTISSSSMNVEATQNEIPEYSGQSKDNIDEEMHLEDSSSIGEKYENTPSEPQKSSIPDALTKEITVENTSVPDIEEDSVLIENANIEPGEIQDESETEVAPLNLDASLTQETIFAMIDKIDSEIGRYEDLLVEIRKNKQSCIEGSNSSSEIQKASEPESLLENQITEQESELMITQLPENAVGELNGTQSNEVTNGKAQKSRRCSLHKRIYAENQMLVQANVKPSLGPIFRKFEDYPFYCENIESHKKIRSLMFNHMRHKYDSLEQKENELRQKYKQYLEAWKVRIVKLDRHKEKKKGRRYLKDELLSSSGPSNLSVSRAQRHGGPYNSDTVRSEAELLEIIQSLENEDLRNPSVRCLRTVATIPPMVLDPCKRELTKYDNRNNLIENPYIHYHCGGSGDKWTKEERDIFVKKYLLYPKQFGKIATFLKNKNARQCVLYYYREKKSIDFKGLIAGRGKKRRQLARKDISKSSTSRSNKSKGNALLQDIDAASRSQNSEEVGDLPDTLPTFKKKKRLDHVHDSSLNSSVKPTESAPTKHRLGKLKIAEGSESPMDSGLVTHIATQPSLHTRKGSSPNTSLDSKQQFLEATIEKPSTQPAKSDSGAVTDGTQQSRENDNPPKSDEATKSSEVNLPDLKSNEEVYNKPLQVDEDLVETSQSEPTATEPSVKHLNTRMLPKNQEPNVHCPIDSAAPVSLLPEDTSSMKNSNQNDQKLPKESSNVLVENVSIKNMVVNEQNNDNDSRLDLVVGKSGTNEENLDHTKTALSTTVHTKSPFEKAMADEGNTTRFTPAKSQSTKPASGKAESTIGKSFMAKPTGSDSSSIRPTPHKPFGIKSHQPHNESAVGKLFIKPSKPIIGKPGVVKSGFNRNMSTKPIPVKALSGKFVQNEKEAGYRAKTLEDKKGSPSQKKTLPVQEKRVLSSQERKELHQEKKGLPSQQKKLFSAQERRMLPSQEKKGVPSQEKNELPPQRRKESLLMEKERPPPLEKEKLFSQEKRESRPTEKEGLSFQDKKKLPEKKTESLPAEKEESSSQDEMDIVDELNAAIEDILDKDSSDEEETIVEEEGTAFIVPPPSATDQSESKPVEGSISISLSPSSINESNKLMEPDRTPSVTASQPLVEDFDLSLDIPSSDEEELLDRKRETSETVDEDDALLEEEINRALLSASSTDDEDETSSETKPISEAAMSTVLDSWSTFEQAEFVECLRLYGKDWIRIAERVKSKKPSDIEEYYSSNIDRLSLEELVREFEENTSKLPQEEATDVSSSSVLDSALHSTVNSQLLEGSEDVSSLYNQPNALTKSSSDEDVEKKAHSAYPTSQPNSDASAVVDEEIRVSTVCSDSSKPQDVTSNVSHSQSIAQESLETAANLPLPIVGTRAKSPTYTGNVQESSDESSNMTTTKVMNPDAVAQVNPKKEFIPDGLLDKNISGNPINILSQQTLASNTNSSLPNNRDVPTTAPSIIPTVNDGPIPVQSKSGSTSIAFMTTQASRSPSINEDSSRVKTIPTTLPYGVIPSGQIFNQPSVIRSTSDKGELLINKGAPTPSEPAYQPFSVSSQQSTTVLSNSPSVNVTTSTRNTTPQSRASNPSLSHPQGKYPTSNVDAMNSINNTVSTETSPAYEKAVEPSGFDSYFGKTLSHHSLVNNSFAPLSGNQVNKDPSSQFSASRKYGESVTQQIMESSSTQVSSSPITSTPTNDTLLESRKKSWEISSASENALTTSVQPMGAFRTTVASKEGSTIHQTGLTSDSVGVQQSRQQYSMTNHPNFAHQSSVINPQPSNNTKFVDTRAQPLVSSASSNYPPATSSTGPTIAYSQSSVKPTLHYPHENPLLGSIPPSTSESSRRIEAQPTIPLTRYVPNTTNSSASHITSMNSEKMGPTKQGSALPNLTYQATPSDQAPPGYTYPSTQMPTPSVSTSMSQNRSEYYRSDFPQEYKKQSSVSRILNHPASVEAPVISPTRSEYSTSSMSSKIESAYFDVDRQETRPAAPKPAPPRARGVTDIFSLLNAPTEDEPKTVKVGKNALMDWFGEDAGPVSSPEQFNSPNVIESKNSHIQSQFNANPVTSQSQSTTPSNSYSYMQDLYSTSYKTQPPTYSMAAPEVNPGTNLNRRSIESIHGSSADPIQMMRQQATTSQPVHLQSNPSTQPQVQLLQLQSPPVGLNTSQSGTQTATVQPQAAGKSRRRAGSQSQLISQPQNHGQLARQASLSQIPSQTSSHSQVPIAQLVNQNSIPQTSRTSTKGRQTQSKPRALVQPQLQPQSQIQPSHSRILSQSPIQHPSQVHIPSVDNSARQTQYPHPSLHQQSSHQSSYHAPIPHQRPSHPSIQPSPGMPQQTNVYSRSQSPAMSLPSPHQALPRRTSSPLQPVPISHSRKPSNPSQLQSLPVQLSSHSSQPLNQPIRHSTPVSTGRTRDLSQPIFSQNTREAVSNSPHQSPFTSDHLNYPQTRSNQHQTYSGSDIVEGAVNFQHGHRAPHSQEGYHSSAPSPNLSADSLPHSNVGHQSMYRQSPQISSSQHTYDARESSLGPRYGENIQPPHRSSTPVGQNINNNSSFVYPPVSLPKYQQPQPQQSRSLHRDSSSILDNTPYRTGSPAILDQSGYRTTSPAVLDGVQIRRTASPATIDASHYRRTTSPSVMDVSQYGRRPQSPVVPVGTGYPRHPHMSMQSPSTSSQIFHPMTSTPGNQNPTYSNTMAPMSMPGMFPHHSGAYAQQQQQPPPKK
ncbi:DNA-binding protein snt1 [Basidiobolus ranarum]|uniref:DNA-binding protein snt1 n=1 Tax=Basidiobolus ranarum TaxID=34480 RepID=A0ABR2X4U4_9FUNG